MDEGVKASIEALSARLDAIEQRLSRGSPSELEAIQTRFDEISDTARIKAAGRADLNIFIRTGNNTSTIEESFTVEELLLTPPSVLADGLVGLSHPKRIEIIVALLNGPMDSTMLLDAAGLNTTGQLYHHLRILSNVGLVERRGPNLWAHQNIGALLAGLFAAKMLAHWRGAPIDEQRTMEG